MAAAIINIKFLADLAQFSKQMQNANRKMRKMGQNFTKTGKNLTVGLTAPILALGGVSVKTFADFEQAMAKVAAISGATGSTFDALNKSALDLGASTRYTSAQVAQLQLNYSKLGFAPDEIIKVTAATLDLALATGSDLANSATVAASTLRGFGLEAGEMQRVVDVMAKSFSSSALDLMKFETAMGSLAPVAKNAGVSIEDATAFLSILVDRGVEASTAGTGLRNIFLDLAGSGETLEDAMQKIAVSTNKNKVAFETFGKRGATVAAIMADNSAEAKELSASYENSAGAAKSMAKIVGNTLEGSLLKMKSALEGAAIALGEELMPYIKQAAKFISELAVSFKNLSAGTKKFIVIAGALLAALGPLLVALGFMMTTVLPGLITAFASLTATMAANPFGLIAVAVAALVGGFVFFNKEVDETIKKQTLLSKVNDTAAKSIVHEKAKLAELLAVARHEGVSKKQRLDAINQLNKISPKYLGNLSLETINTDVAREAVEKYNTELLKTAKVKAAQVKLQEIQAAKIDIELKEGKKLVADANKLKKLKEEAVTIEDRLRIRTLEKIGYGVRSNGIHAAQLVQLQAEEDLLLKIITSNKSLNTIKDVDAPADATRKVATVLDISTVGIKDVDTEAKAKFENLTEALAGTKPKIQTELNAITAQFSAFDVAANDIIAAAATNVVAGFGTMIGGLISGASGIADFKNLLLGSLGGMLEQLGKIAIQAGIGLLAIKKAFETLNPFVAIAAGVALVAFGGVIKSQISDVGTSNDAGSFAGGGMVGGSSFSGDKLFARVNSGEMILNNRQQNNLAGLIGAGGGQSVNVVLQPSIDFVGDKFRVLLNKVDQKNLRRK